MCLIQPVQENILAVILSQWVTWPGSYLKNNYDSSLRILIKIWWIFIKNNYSIYSIFLHSHLTAYYCYLFYLWGQVWLTPYCFEHLNYLPFWPHHTTRHTYQTLPLLCLHGTDRWWTHSLESQQTAVNQTLNKRFCSKQTENKGNNVFFGSLSSNMSSESLQ